MEDTTDSGLVVISRTSTEPNTVGPDPLVHRPPPPVQPWSGWPTGWSTPNWGGHVATLTDTAWTCLDLNASVLASFPPYLVDAAPSLDASWLINPDPDIYSSWYEFAKALFWDHQLGEAFVLATARYDSGYGWPARFHVVPPWEVDVDFSPSGLRRYHIGNEDVTGDLLHIRYTSTKNDAHGHGPLEAGAGRVVAAQALSRYATDLASGGGIPNSVLTHPGRLTAEQAAELQYQWVTARTSSMGLPAVLSGGVDFKTLSFNPEEMALVDLSKWTEARIAVLLGVPPFLVGLPSGGDSLTYSTTESLFDYHWRAGLRPKASAVCQALSYWALPRGTTLEVDRDEYVRPGPKERAETWKILVELGVITPEDVARFERFMGGTTAAPHPFEPFGAVA